MLNGLPQYSYVPKEPRLKPEDAKFIHWMFFHYKLENRKEIMDIMKEWKKLYEDKNIKNGYSIWLIELGLDNNMIALTENYKDGGDFYERQEADNALMEAEAGALWGKMSQLLLLLKTYTAIQGQILVLLKSRFYIKSPLNKRGFFYKIINILRGIYNENNDLQSTCRGM